jgi:MOSC domain-containing protein YiiM
MRSIGGDPGATLRVLPRWKECFSCLPIDGTFGRTKHSDMAMQQQFVQHTTTETTNPIVVRLLAASVGSSAPLDVGSTSPGMVVNSGIRKTPVSVLHDRAYIEVKRLGLVGDEQVDLSVHGGLEKAVYMYPVEHYEWWRERRLEAGVMGADDPLPFAAMGENLTTSGLLETQLWVGDRILIDEVEFRVESPRNPCYKFNGVMGYAWVLRCLFKRGQNWIHFRRFVDSGNFWPSAGVDKCDSGPAACPRTAGTVSRKVQLRHRAASTHEPSWVKRSSATPI